MLNLYYRVLQIKAIIIDGDENDMNVGKAVTVLKAVKGHLVSHLVL